MGHETVVPAASIADADWDRVVRHAPLGQFWNLSSWRRYSLAYAGRDARDDSFGVLEDGRLVAVCSLIREGTGYTMGGEPGPMPAAWSDTALMAALLHAHTLSPGGLTFRMPPDRTLHPVTRLALEQLGWTKGGWETRVVSLASSPEILWRGVRKSYHALIHRTEREYILVVSVGAALADAYRLLHQETVGQVAPRSPSTYDCQAEWLESRQALLLGALHRQANRWDGFAYLFVHHGLVYYGSGPSRHGFTVMHGLQWAAIRECQERGHQRYEVGWVNHATDTKGKGIEMFKKGFGGQDVPQDTWTAPRA